MNEKKLWAALCLIMTLVLLVGCATPTPEVIEKVVTKEVEKVVTQVIKETVKETVIVEGTPQVVEKEVTKVVEKVITATPEPKAPGGGTFVGSLYITISMIDPHRAVEFSDGTVLPLVFEGLVAFGADGDWKGVLAESWDVSDDGLTWTFHLREGVKFHNGREMTADDVIYSFDRILDENTGASMRSYFTKIESYEAVDPYTVQFVLNGGAGTFLSELGLGTRAAIIARECVTNDGTVVHPIGTGPFEFLWWKPGEEFRVKRFDDYWGQVAKIDEAVFKFIPDDTVRLTALQTGEIDWMRRIPFEQIPKMQEDTPEGVNLELLYESRTVRFNFNCTRPPFDDPRVRRAIAHIIDKDAYNEAIWYGVGNPHNQPFAPGSFLELPVDDPYRSGDVEAAKALLTEAGYPDGFEINAISHVPYKEAWELLQALFDEAGITVNVEFMDSAQWTKQAKELDYDAMLASQSGIYHWDRTYSYFEETSSASWLVGGYQNDAVSEFLAKGRDEADLVKAKEYYTEILQMIQDDMAAVFIAAQPDVQAWRTWVEGYEPNASNTNLVGPSWGLNYISLDSKPE